MSSAASSIEPLEASGPPTICRMIRGTMDDDEAFTFGKIIPKLTIQLSHNMVYYECFTILASGE